MHCYWYRCARGGFCGCSDEESVGEGDGPGKELDDQGRLLEFCCADDAEDVFDVVAVRYVRRSPAKRYRISKTYTMEAWTPYPRASASFSMRTVLLELRSGAPAAIAQVFQRISQSESCMYVTFDLS